MMTLKNISNILLIAVCTLSLWSCEDYFGNKTELDFIEVPDYNANRQVAYVPILPVLDDFLRPTDICVGFDELIYVVDELAEEVIAMDQAGRILGRKFIPGATAVSQDRAFDLLVIGTFDTTLVNGGDTSNFTFSTIYRIDQFGGGGYNLNNAEVSNKIIHPFYTGRRGNSLDQVEFVRFNKISIIADNGDPELNNQFYVTREGEGNSGGGLVPNDAVCLFKNNDEFVSTINVTTTSGVFGDYFESPSGITTLAQPPQISAQAGRNFLFTSADPNTTLKVQLLVFVESEFSSFYRPVLLPPGDTSQADGFINTPNKFSRPTDITVTGDGTEFIFVVDSEKDSLFQFNGTGLEGVLPPAATGITKYQKASFGGTGAGLTQFREPSAVAYFDQILYVADAGNGRVLRFKLTLDFE